MSSQRVAMNPQVQARRAIEALRAGVPNRDAVITLGSAHPHIEEQFRQVLSDARQAEAEAQSGTGFLVAGNFGTGKSHLLEYLQQIALQEHFVSSKVVISKETPLYDPVKLYRAAIRAATVPGRVGSALAQIASELEFGSQRYVDFYKWVQGPAAGLNQRFAATIFLYEQARQDPELLDRIISFWSGDPIQVGEIRAALRRLGQRVNYAIGPAGVRALAYQRFRFAARLMQAAGFAGWVLLFDEVDLVARYSLPQRGKAYAEMARWTGNLKDDPYPGVTAVLAITSAYEAEVLSERNDREAVPGKLRASVREADHLIAEQADRGMKQIGKAVRLVPPSPTVIDDTYEKVRAIHGQAHGWNPPPLAGRDERLASTPMREYVRRWINEWDLRRLYPEYEPEIEATAIGLSYAEDAELEIDERRETDDEGRPDADPVP